MEKYREYIGKWFFYGKEKILIKNIKRVSANIIVLTNYKTYAFWENEIDTFLNQLKPFDENNKLITYKNMGEIIETNQEIKSILFKAIESVQNDKAFVPQANAICNITTQLINLKKLELLSKSK